MGSQGGVEQATQASCGGQGHISNKQVSSSPVPQEMDQCQDKGAVRALTQMPKALGDRSLHAFTDIQERHPGPGVLESILTCPTAGPFKLDWQDGLTGVPNVPQGG